MKKNFSPLFVFVLDLASSRVLCFALFHAHPLVSQIGGLLLEVGQADVPYFVLGLA